MNTSEHKAAVPPTLVMLVSVLSVSTAAVVIRQAQQEVSSLTIAAYRLGIAALIIAPFAFFRNRGEMHRLTFQQILLAVISGVLLAFHFGTWITSLEYTSVTSSVVLVSLSSLWVALLSILVLKEKISRFLWVGLALALVGSLVVAFSNFNPNQSVENAFLNRSFFGNLLAFSGAWFLAGYLIIGRNLRASLSLAPYATIIFGIASLTLFCGSFILGKPVVGFPWHNFLFLVFLAIVPQIFGHAAFNWALRYLSATFISIALLAEPIGSAVLAFIVLKETPTLMELLGGGMILIGIFISSRSQR